MLDAHRWCVPQEGAALQYDQLKFALEKLVAFHVNNLLPLARVYERVEHWQFKMFLHEGKMAVAEATIWFDTERKGPCKRMVHSKKLALYIGTLIEDIYPVEMKDGKVHLTRYAIHTLR